MLTETAHKFRQGMIAANTVAIISRLERDRALDQSEMRVLGQAAKLLDESVSGGMVFDPEVKQLKADNNAVRAFHSAITAARACGQRTEAKELRNIVSWLERIQQTLRSLAECQIPGNEDIKAAKWFFNCLADEMSASITKPHTEQPSFTPV